MKGNFAHKLCSTKTVKVQIMGEIVGLVVEEIDVLA